MNNLTFDKKIFTEYTSRNAIFEHMQKIVLWAKECTSRQLYKQQIYLPALK